MPPISLPMTHTFSLVLHLNTFTDPFTGHGPGAFAWPSKPCRKVLHRTELPDISPAVVCTSIGCRPRPQAVPCCPLLHTYSRSGQGVGFSARRWIRRTVASEGPAFPAVSL